MCRCFRHWQGGETRLFNRVRVGGKPVLRGNRIDAIDDRVDGVPVRACKPIHINAHPRKCVTQCRAAEKLHWAPLRTILPGTESNFGACKAGSLMHPALGNSGGSMAAWNANASKNRISHGRLQTRPAVHPRLPQKCADSGEKHDENRAHGSCTHRAQRRRASACADPHTGRCLKTSAYWRWERRQTVSNARVYARRQPSST